MLHPDFFYESYFQDHQHLMDLRQKGNAHIQSFNVKVTRQEKSRTAEVASSTANRERLEGMFRTALYAMFEAFEHAFVFEHAETITHLRDDLVNPAISYMVNFFASSHCRTCYKGRKLDSAMEKKPSLIPSFPSLPRFLQTPTDRQKSTKLHDFAGKNSH